MELRYNRRALWKHRVTQFEVDSVLASPVTKGYDLPDGPGGAYRVMAVGFTEQGRFLEIGMQDLGDGADYVFHAMDATKAYRKRFSQDHG